MVEYLIEVNGNISNSGSHTGAGKIYLDGGGGHNLSGTGSYTNLEVNDAGGATLAANTTVNGTLTLTAGTFTVGAFTLTLNGAAIAGTGSNLITGTTSSLTFGPGTGNSNTALYIPTSVVLEFSYNKRCNH